MEANSMGGDPPLGQDHQDKKWSEAELEMIHAAMMEELGVGRKDTLPLDDKSKGKSIPVNVRKPTKKQVDDDPNDPTARWRNIQFDDVDPADAELDSMYDGQLYRLRKEAMGDQYHQGSSSRGGRGDGRGRGGSSRGGHSGRGRGGRDSTLTDRRSEISNVPHMSSRTPKTYFNDARRGIHSNTRVDAVLSSLRASAAQAEAAHQAARKKEAQTVIAEQHRRVSVNTGTSRRPQAPTARPQFALASQDAFLAYAGFNSAQPKAVPSSLATQEPSRHLSLSVTSQEGHRAPVDPVKDRLLQPSKTADASNSQSQQDVQHQTAEGNSAFSHEILSKENQPHTVQNGDIGLEGSRWATSDPVTEVTPSRTAAPSTPIPKPNTLATYGRTVLRENQVQVTKGCGKPIRGFARLIKNNPQEDRYFTIELDVGDDKNVLREEVRDGDLFTCESTVLKYRPKRGEDGSAPIPAVTWTIKFQMPYQSWTFYNPVASNPNARNRHKQPDVNTNTESDADQAAVTQHQPLMSIEESDTVGQTQDCVSVNVTEHAQADNASKLLRPALDVDIRSNVASVGSDRVSISNSSFILQQELEAPSSSPQRVISSEWPLVQTIADNSLAGLLDSYHPGGSNRISSQAWSEMNEVAGFEQLVSFGHDEPESESIHPLIQALLNMDDTQLIQDTFNYFENQPEGSFLHQLSVMVVKGNIPPASSLTGEEILSSPQYQEAAENLVGSRLCHSETFSMMPDIVTIGYTTEKARKVLKKAIAHRDCQDGSEYGAASQSTSASTQPETGLSISQHCAEPFMVQASEQPKTADMVGYVKPAGPRIIYSAELLLSLRQNASRFKSELISNEVMRYIVQLPAGGKPVNPANIIGTTKNGIPVVAGRDHLSRARGNTGGPAFKPATTVGAWKDYSVAESGDSIELSRNTIAANERELPSVQPSTAPVVQKIPPAHDSRTSTPIKKEPVMSPPKPASTVQTQETDMTLWGALLTTVRDSKKEERLRAMSNSKSQTPLVSSRGSRHIPTNSECDRLAKTFEGLNLSNKVKEEPSTMKSEQVAASDTGSADIQPPLKDQTQPVSFLSLYETMKNSVLKLPPSLSSRPQSVTSTTPTQSVGKAVKSDTGSIPPTPTLAVATSSATSELKTEHAVIATPNPQAPTVPASPPVSAHKAESLVKVKSLKVDVSSAHSHLEKLEPAATSRLEPNNVVHCESENTRTLVNMQPTTLMMESEIPKTLETVASAPQVSEKASLLENVTNKDLKGVLGLKASRWASSAPAPAPQAPSPSARQPPSMATAVPIYPVFPPYPYSPSQTFGSGFASPPPVHAPMASHHPALHTVLVPDPMQPGCYIEVTGISTSTAKVVPSMLPMQPMMGPPNRQENFPYFQQHPPGTNFTTEMYRSHRPNKSSASDLNFNPSNTPFTPPRGRGANAMSPQERAALSPVRQGEDVQAKLQSRLNSSLAGKSPGA